jgi:hypothetical protein
MTKYKQEVHNCNHGGDTIKLLELCEPHLHNQCVVTIELFAITLLTQSLLARYPELTEYELDWEINKMKTFLKTMYIENRKLETLMNGVVNGVTQ